MPMRDAPLGLLFPLRITLAWPHSAINRADTAATQQIHAAANRLAKPAASPHHVRDNKKRQVASRGGSHVAEGSDSIVADTAARIFADLAEPQAVNRAKDDAWKMPLWNALTEAGLPLAWVPDRLGGSGAGLADGFAVLGVSGRYALAVPLAETLLAGWLLSKAGIASPAGPMSVAPVRSKETIEVDSDGCLNGRARAVPFADEAEHIALFASGDKGPAVALVAAADCRIGSGRSLSGDPSAEVIFAGVRPRAIAAPPASVDRHSLLLMGATIRSLQIAGALEATLALCVSYANERVAFERKIGKFQAVQQNLARLAGETAAALAASGSAAEAIAQAAEIDDAIFLEVASAKIRCAEAATEGAAIAHQVFGAIGFTQEHILHRFTLRMLGWRDDFGNESEWAAKLGKDVARLGGDEFWRLVASR
jgi:acyl-CoA dehydrogenase